MANSRLCSVHDCGKPHRANGLCFKHYMRVRRHGHVVTTRTEPGEPQIYYRDVVMAYEGDECLLWPYAKYASGYGAMIKDGANGHVSRFVCEDANGPAPTPEHQAAHSCGKGHLGCVTKRHLSWKTRKENETDKDLHGTRIVGEKSNFAKITQDQVRYILSQKGAKSQRAIAAEVGLSQQAISRIHRRERWAWLEEGKELNGP